MAQALTERNELGFDSRKQKILFVLRLSTANNPVKENTEVGPGAFSKRLACNYCSFPTLSATSRNSLF